MTQQPPEVYVTQVAAIEMMKSSDSASTWQCRAMTNCICEVVYSLFSRHKFIVIVFGSSKWCVCCKANYNCHNKSVRGRQTIRGKAFSIPYASAYFVGGKCRFLMCLAQRQSLHKVQSKMSIMAQHSLCACHRTAVSDILLP